jgi:dinuclear metal center YbgI/SA1388 family protein
MATTVAAVVQALARIAPPELAEAWDNVGLLVGDPDAPCHGVLVALEVDKALLRRAEKADAQLIISHHPVILDPLRRVAADDVVGALLLAAAHRGIALAAAHTNYDVAPGGVSDVLADLLGLKDTAPLARSEGGAQAKIVVFTPAGDLEAVVRALSESGAGVIGRYRECTFRTPGTGTFRAMAGADPAVGRVGRREEVEELRVEAVAPLALAEEVAAAVRAAHSYEEPAIDVYPLEGGPREVGIGRCGRLSEPMRAQALVGRIKTRLRVEAVRVVGDLRRRVERVAVCGGSGGKLVAEAAGRGCQLYLTGDLSHHQALEAAACGLVVVDAGHAPTEAPAIAALAKRLEELCPEVDFKAAKAGATGPFLHR